MCNEFLCALCEKSFEPTDWQNDVCDNCLYKKSQPERLNPEASKEEAIV